MTVDKLTKLLLRIPYFIAPGPIPPLWAMNEFLRRGKYDAGMSGCVKWKRFQIEEGQYADVVIELMRLKPGLYELDPPPNIADYRKWSNWRNAIRVGYKFDELMELYDKCDEFFDEIKLLEKKDLFDDALQVKLELMKVTSRISEIIRESRLARDGSI
jgi:hypothetical protein